MLQQILLVSVALSGYLANALVFIQEPRDLFVVPNLAIWWHCEAESTITDDVSYRWTFNGAEVSRSGSQHLIFRNGTLYINGILESNEGQYQCFAGDGLGQIQSRVVSLAIAYMDEVFALNPQTQSGYTGQTIALFCEIDSHPPAVITWLHDDLPVAIDTTSMVTVYRSQLNLVAVGYAEAGRYQCVARNPLTNQTKYSNTAVLTLQGGPEWILEPNPMIINKNSIGYLHCVADGNPAPEISWYSVQGVGQEAVIVTSGRFVVFENGTLRITDTKPEDGGFYKCVATNSVDSISKTVLLSVTELPTTPTFTSSPANTTVEEGDPVNWFCAASGEPPPVISWRKENGVVGGSRWTYPYPGALLIDPVSRVDMGWFICHAESNAGDNVHRVYLDVQYPPSIIDFPPPSVLVEMGDNVHLPCHVDANPQPEIQWTTPLGGLTESSGITISSNGSLLIQSAAPIHMGTYMCNARNYLNYVSIITELQVRAAPVFLEPPADENAMLESTLVINCHTTGYPPPTILWYLPPDGREITTGYVDAMFQVLANGSLVVQRVGVQHEGLFRCSAENQLGIVQAGANIRVLGPPKFNETDYSLLVYLGSSILLDCEPTGRPSPIVQWAKEGLPLQPDAVTAIFPNNSLYIESLAAPQYGDYQCYATNEVGSSRLEVMVLQPNSPVFTVKPANMTGNSSKPLLVPCEATSTLTPDVTWFETGDDGRLVEVPGYKISQEASIQRVYVNAIHTLVFQELAVSDEGWYICVANNSMGDISADTYIHVQVPPVIIRASTPKSGDVGEVTTLSCLAEGQPDPRVTWRSPGGQEVTASDDEYFVDDGVLTIRVTDVEAHMGTWQCLACNIFGCAREPVELYVRGPPVITEVHGYMDGLARVIACKAEGTPFPEIRYYWGDLNINPMFPPRGHSINAEGPTLRILRERIDAVSYKCRAINQYGIDTKVFVLPSMPHELSLVDVGSRFALLTWLPPDVQGGFPELNYTIDYSYTIPGNIEPVPSVQQGILAAPHTLSDLEAYRDYTFRVAAYNVLGTSAYTESVMARTLQDAPDPIRQLTLNFAGEVVHVTWEAPAKMNGNTSSIEYHVLATEVINNEVIEFVKVPHGGPLETYLTSLDYDDEYRITVTAVNTAIGRASSAVQDIFNVRHKVPFMVPMLTRVASMGPQSIEVEWSYPEREGRELSGFLVKLTLPDQNDAVHSVDRVDGHTLREHRVVGLKERHTYSMSVAAFSREGSGPYSGEEIVITSYAILSPLPYKDSNKLTMRGTTIAIIFGSIFGILLVLVVVLLVWQWYRLYQQKTEKMVADIYNQKKRMMYHQDKSPTLETPGYTVIPVKAKADMRSEGQRPRNGNPYGPGRKYSYQVSPRGSVVLPSKKRMYKKKGDSTVAYTEMSGSPALQYPPPYTRQPQRNRRPGHPLNPRNGQEPPGPIGFPGPRPPYPSTPRPQGRGQRPPGSRSTSQGSRPVDPWLAQVEVKPPAGRGSYQQPTRVAGHVPGSTAGQEYQRPRRLPHGGVAVNVPGRPLGSSLSASQENLANHQKRGPSPSPIRGSSSSPAGSVSSSHPSASSLRSSRVRRSPQGSPGSSGQAPSSRGQTPTSRADTGNDPSLSSDMDGSMSLDSDQLPILSRIHEGHPLPNEGPSRPSTPETVDSQSDDDYIYAQPNKMKKECLDSLPEGSVTTLDNRVSEVDSSPRHSLTPSIDSVQDLSLDRKGRVFSSTAIRGPKGKAGGRSQAKNLGRNPLPGPDFWSPEISDIGSDEGF